MNVRISIFIICAEAIRYLLLHNLHGCTFKDALHEKLGVKKIETQRAHWVGAEEGGKDRTIVVKSSN